ncbi:MAG: tryptophan-rich sensory protein [Chlamydiales bacterium]|nr:tryptophan-rich sensory protein [Chlamydiales bacterium]
MTATIFVLSLVFFFVQLFLNFTWSWLFFYQKSPGYALFDIALLLLFIGLTVHAFWQQSRLAAYLLLPYLAWVSYAAYLNFSIWLYN